MITEDYISFEVAKLLKEEGFEGRMHTFYTEEGTDIESSYVVPSNFFPIYRPTLQMAMKWLREVHSIDISIDIRFWTDDEGVDVKSWRYTVYRTDEIEDFGQSDTYEEACEEAIKYCLENLV